MKNLFVLLLLVIVISCKKEQEKTLQDYCGTYSLESTTIKFVLNLGGVCYTGMDSLEIHIADSLEALQPHSYKDTIINTKIIKIIPSPNEKNQLVVLGLFPNIYGGDSCTFYNPYNTNELVFLNCQNNYSLDDKYLSKTTFNESEINFDFKMWHRHFPETYTLVGVAKKIN